MRIEADTHYDPKWLQALQAEYGDLRSVGATFRVGQQRRTGRPNTTAERNRQIFREFEGGKTRHELAKDHGLSYDTIKGIIRTQHAAGDG
jgi:DNA-binding NarL/FixJ family response regulator